MMDVIKRSWFSLLMLALGIFFIAGYFTVWQDQAASCTEPVMATITHSEEVTVTGEDGINYEYRITAEYEVDGKIYSYAETTGARFDAGDSYHLVYNPDDPSEAMTPGRARMMWLVPVVGLVLIAYFLWSTGLLKRRSAHQDKSQMKEVFP